MTAITAGSALGAPIAIVLNWYLSTFKLHAPIPIEVAIASGSVISTIITVWWHICAQLLARVGISVSSTPPET